MGKSGEDVKHLKYTINKILKAVMLSGKDLLMTHEGCFQILSCDFLIDRKFNPWLINVSSKVNLKIDTKT